MSTPAESAYKLRQRDMEKKSRRAFLPRDFVESGKATRRFPDGSVYEVQANGAVVLKRGKRG